MAENQDTYKHIVRIANVDVPGEKAVKIALTKIKGVGMQFADIVCTLAHVEKNQKMGTLTDSQILKLNEIVKNPQSAGMPDWMLNRRKDYETGENKHILTGDLIFTLDNDLKRLKKIKSLRGVRHGKKLPVRGQRTRSNFRKTKGKVVGVKKKGKK
ncbi:30S ribosomal protein S13 [Candidatus Woesearchaeota archaeon CG10_big_fil_rev_8_21_14_0_10_32_24]|nr:MAG: 30S ribosomal protein S13 [Candidatus Woesearchaeota archaeon CG10_big_fil_rev_8_21_14_0_10_32_24]